LHTHHHPQTPRSTTHTLSNTRLFIYKSPTTPPENVPYMSPPTKTPHTHYALSLSLSVEADPYFHACICKTHQTDTTHKPTHELHDPPLSVPLSLVIIYMSGTIPATNEPTHIHYTLILSYYIYATHELHELPLSLSLFLIIYVCHAQSPPQMNPPIVHYTLFLSYYIYVTHELHDSLLSLFLSLIYIYVTQDPHHK